MSIDDDYFTVRELVNERGTREEKKAWVRLSKSYAHIDRHNMEWEKVIGALCTLRRFLVGGMK